MESYSTELHREGTEVHREKTKNMNDISSKIIGCSIEVHKQLGPGLLESAYQECLYYELVNLGLKDIKKKLCEPLCYFVNLCVITIKR